jgi:hypothetical protein
MLTEGMLTEALKTKVQFDAAFHHHHHHYAAHLAPVTPPHFPSGLIQTRLK